MIPTTARASSKSPETRPPPARQSSGHRWHSRSRSRCAPARPPVPPQACKARAAPARRVRRPASLSHAAVHPRARSRSRCTHTVYKLPAYVCLRAASVAACRVDSPRSPRSESGRRSSRILDKLRPHASVPIAEETRKTQEQFFPLTLTSTSTSPAHRRGDRCERRGHPVRRQDHGKTRCLRFRSDLEAGVRLAPSAAHTAMRAFPRRPCPQEPQRAPPASRPPQL